MKIPTTHAEIDADELRALRRLIGLMQDEINKAQDRRTRVDEIEPHGTGGQMSDDERWRYWDYADQRRARQDDGGTTNAILVGLVEENKRLEAEVARLEAEKASMSDLVDRLGEECERLLAEVALYKRKDK
jgi:hypothetical protein